MNWRTVGTIRRGLRHGESGQAFSELMVSLVAILAAFIGFLLVAALSTARVSTLVRARENVDVKVRNNYVSVYNSSDDAVSIRDWHVGPDGIPFTTDDRLVSGSAGDSELFMRQLSDSTEKINLQAPPSSLPELRSDFSSLSPSNFFVEAASLVSETETPDQDPLRKHKLDSVNAVQWLFGIRDAQIVEKVYMPAHKESSAERGD